MPTPVAGDLDYTGTLTTDGGLMDAGGWERLAARMAGIVGGGGVRTGEPMAAHTTFGIGGPAAIYVVPGTAEDVRALVGMASDAGVSWFVLGRGSDLLVADTGYEGVVIALADELANVTVNGPLMTCEAGCTLAEAAEMACDLGLSGLEFACGIPGSVGGGVYMNAGAYGASMADVVSSVRVLAPGGALVTLGVDELALGYRTSRVRTDGLIVLSATFALAPAEPARIRATMDELTVRREAKQPLELPSAGSTFKRPEGHFAGKLIADAGLKGYRVGGAAVSDKHAGFVVNVGDATADDVCAVISHVQGRVRDLFGVTLEPEVQFLGFRQAGQSWSP